MPGSAAVPRLARTLDLCALALVVVGAATYARAFLGLRALESLTGASPTPGAAMAQFDRWWRLSHVGAGVLAAGLAVGGAAALLARARRRGAQAAQAALP